MNWSHLSNLPVFEKGQPSPNDCSNIIDSIADEYDFVFFKNLELILSIPDEEESFRLLIIAAIPSYDINI